MESKPVNYEENVGKFIVDFKITSKNKLKLKIDYINPGWKVLTIEFTKPVIESIVKYMDPQVAIEEIIKGMIGTVKSVTKEENEDLTVLIAWLNEAFMNALKSWKIVK